MLNAIKISGGDLLENINTSSVPLRFIVEQKQTNKAEIHKNVADLFFIISGEVDFICNSGNKRMYIQSALDMPTPEKIDQETNSLRHINDGFPKIVIVGGLTPSYVNTDGISIMNVIDFLKDTEMGLL